MRLLIDENVPESVASLFRERGHEVLYARDFFLPGAADHLLAAVADREGAIVVTWNLRDFREITSRAPRGTRATLRRLGWIAFRCNEASGRRRLEEVIGVIEYEYERMQRRHDARLFVEILQQSIKLHV